MVWRRFHADHRHMNDLKKISRCPSCSSDDIVAIAMNVEAEAVLFRACHHCEHRWWEQNGEQVSLDDVLALVNRH
jgi:formate dehydrogenase maturation protein FdhE